MTLNKLLATPHDPAATVLRLTLGIVMFPHGAQKMLGWYGGYGFGGTMAYFTETLNIPWIFALLAILAEFAGSLGLITGLLTRVAAFGIACNMVVAMFMAHLPYGFFVNWTGKQEGEGIEYHLLALGLSIAIMIRGGGAYSLDRRIARAPQAP